MAVFTESGYTWANGKLARILHAGNMARPHGVSLETRVGDDATAGELVLNDSTVDRWRPFTNLIASPENFGASDWTLPSIGTIAADGQTFDEGASTGTRSWQQTINLTTTGEHVVSIEFEPQSITGIRLRVVDSAAAVFFVNFDLRDMTPFGGNFVDARIRRMSGNRYIANLHFLPTATGNAQFQLQTMDPDTGSSGYTGTNRKIRFLRYAAHISVGVAELAFIAPVGISCVGIAAHNIGSRAGRIRLQEREDESDSLSQVATIFPQDDSPIMLFLNSRTASRWRLVIDQTTLGEVGVFRAGNPLVMQRGLYAGASPGRMNRATEVTGNLSGSGELLGRSRKRTVLQENWQWQNLTRDWVRANLDGPQGLIQSLEERAAFVAWRPQFEQDVAYLMRGNADAPQAQGVRDLWSFSMSGEAHAYE